MFLFVFVAAFTSRFYLETKNILSEPVRSWKEDLTADCAVVLTGGVGRLRESIALLQRNSVQWLVVSGAHASIIKSDLLTPWELIWGVDQERIILEKNSQTTYGNALQSIPILEALKCQNVLIVTSSIHMTRAYKTFEASLPDSFKLIKYSITPGRNEVSWAGVSIEALKAIFYSIWAY